MPKDNNKISDFHRAIADNYIANGGNGKAAYMTVRPTASPSTASVNSCVILKRDEVQAYLEERQSTITKKSIADKDFLIQEAHDIGLEAREAGKLNTALTAVDTKAKLNRVYDKEGDSQADYSKLIQTLVIQGDVNVYNDKENKKEIDITPG